MVCGYFNCVSAKIDFKTKYKMLDFVTQMCVCVCLCACVYKRMFRGK